MKNKRKLNIKRIIFFILIIAIIITIFYISKMHRGKGYSGDPAFPSDVYGTKVNDKFIEKGTEARTGRTRNIKYIVIHETDNTACGADAKNHAEYLSKNNKTSTSWHYTVDDREIYHHIPDNEVAHHAANDKGNLYGIGIELCVNEDGKFEKTFTNGAKLVAYLLKEYDLKLDAIKTHNDFSGKDCPHTILRDNRMNELIEKVKSYL